MIAYAGILAVAAEAAGMKTPPDPDNFEPSEYPHFHVFCTVQLGAPMPQPTSHWQNARLIAAISDEEIKKVTYEQLVTKGLEVGYSSAYAAHAAR